MTNFNKSSVGIIGGCGHVGLPLGLALTSKGCRVTLIDVNENTVESVNSGVPPFGKRAQKNYLFNMVGNQ